MIQNPESGKVHILRVRNEALCGYWGDTRGNDRLDGMQGLGIDLCARCREIARGEAAHA